MKSSKRTLIILIFLLIGAQAFRLASKLHSQAADEPATLGDAINTAQQAQPDASTEVQDVQPEDSAQDSPASTQETTEDTQNVSLLSSEDYLIINRNSDTTQNSEVEEISLNHQDMEDLIKKEYEKVREKFTYSQMTLQLTDDDRSFRLTMSGYSGESTTKNIISFLSLSSKFNDIHSLFTADTVSVTDLSCSYTTNEARNSIEDTY